MNDPATPLTATQLRRGGRADARRGRVLVGDHVGQTAGHAAQTIRRSGLRPALERSLGCEPELIGQIVAQEPSPGSELGRNAMVTLYVGAPGAAAGEESPDPPPAPSVEGVASAVAMASVVVSEDRAEEAYPKVRRRRKPGLAQGRPRSALDAARSAVGRDAGDCCGDVAALAEEATHTWLETAAASAPVAPRPAVSGQDTAVAEVLDEEELVALAEEIFAGRAGVSWRRLYPTRASFSRTGNKAASQ
jgi:hypothetical protein